MLAFELAQKVAVGINQWMMNITNIYSARAFLLGTQQKSKSRGRKLKMDRTSSLLPWYPWTTLFNEERRGAQQVKLMRDEL